MTEKIIAELPTGGPSEGGGIRPTLHRPNPGELPPFETATGLSREAVAELFRLRDRVNALESQILAGRIGLHFPPNPGIHELPTHLEAKFTGGELRGPDYGGGATLDEILKLLKQILGIVKPPPLNPGEIPP